MFDTLAVGPFRPEYCRFRRGDCTSSVSTVCCCSRAMRRAVSECGCSIPTARRRRCAATASAASHGCAGTLPEATDERFVDYLRGREYRITCRGADSSACSHLRRRDSAVAAQRRLRPVARGRGVRRTDDSAHGVRIAVHLPLAGNPTSSPPPRAQQWLFGSDGRLRHRRFIGLGERANRLREVFPKGITSASSAG